MVSCIAQSRHMSTTMSDIASVYKDVLHFSARLWTRQAHCILCLISGSILIIFIIKRSFDSIFLINFCSWKCFYVWMDIKKCIKISLVILFLDTIIKIIDNIFSFSEIYRRCWLIKKYHKHTTTTNLNFIRKQKKSSIEI